MRSGDLAFADGWSSGFVFLTPEKRYYDQCYVCQTIMTILTRIP